MVSFGNIRLSTMYSLINIFSLAIGLASSILFLLAIIQLPKNPKRRLFFELMLQLWEN